MHESLKAVLGRSDFADVLARHGLGSASIYAHDVNPEAVARDHSGVRYRSYDLWEAGPERIQEMLRAVVALFDEGAENEAADAAETIDCYFDSHVGCGLVDVKRGI